MEQIPLLCNYFSVNLYNLGNKLKTIRWESLFLTSENKKRKEIWAQKLTALLCSLESFVFRPLPCFSLTRSCAVSPPEPTGSPDQAFCWTAPRRSSHPSWTHFSTRPRTTHQTAVWCQYQSCRLLGHLWQQEARLWSGWPGKLNLKRRRKRLAVVNCVYSMCCRDVLYCVISL